MPIYGILILNNNMEVQNLGKFHQVRGTPRESAKRANKISKFLANQRKLVKHPSNNLT